MYWWSEDVKRIMSFFDRLLRTLMRETPEIDNKIGTKVLQRYIAYGREEVILPDGRRIVREWKSTDRSREPEVHEYIEEAPRQDNTRRSPPLMPIPLPAPEPPFPINPPMPFPQTENDSLLLDVIEMNNEVVVVAEVPTTDKESIRVEPHEGAIRIYCDGRLIHETQLPQDIDTSKMQVNFKNRVVEVRIPKKKVK